MGPYQLLQKLGQGGMGSVFKVRHVRLGKTMALKIMSPDMMQNPEAVSRFEREMLAVGQVQHPNVVQAHDAGEIDGVHYIALEYVEGKDLQQLVREHGPLSVMSVSRDPPGSDGLGRSARIGSRPSRHQAGQSIRDDQGPGEDS